MNKKVLFVCLGNICRSPMAEGSFKYLLEKKGLSEKVSCDSAGTSSYHIGDPPDGRMSETALKHGIILSHSARQLVVDDFNEFDYIIAMDAKNYENIQLLGKKVENPKSEIILMRQFDPNQESKDVPDPYYGGMNGFEEVYQIVTRCNERLLEHILKEENF